MKYHEWEKLAASLGRSTRLVEMRLNFIGNNIRMLSTEQRTPKVCIIGAGPAGFYAAQQMLKGLNDVTIDILEKLPLPFGLVRFGVAPDHPEVKNVLNTFHKTATNPRVQFLGNINIGTDVTVPQLRELYDAVLLTFGAQKDQKLNIPGENLENIISGRRFVGWYNGVPTDKDLEINLNVEEVVIIGQGNVAVDITRILLMPVDKLKNTDITSYALDRLSQSRVRKVSMIGRRGPLQVAFTIAELRELIKLENMKTVWRPQDFAGVQTIVPTLARPRKRLTELMLKSLEESMNLTNNSTYTKELHPIFLRSPLEFRGTDHVKSIRLSVNRLRGDMIQNQVAEAIGEFEEITCGLALRSIGYKSLQIDNSIPFDVRKGRVENVAGKVDGNLYSTGWAATGPVGVILSTMTNAFEVGRLICKELKGSLKENKAGSDGLRKILDSKGVQIVSYSDWEKIDRVECERGKQLGKSREKIVDIAEMLKIAAT
ncbi:NADPH:adrenodoxin oxidoreductase, mitochondrial isoform X3 [Harpegnathos saltator]|uniref:NADPH:adrenodoxin oxidoreductase, mitochondrial isoform X3 n=1 Tax=Harpegnathos saltator TaxID=610380 RepID=UPI00058C4A2D|nr:NADPH:adrenodoxin oxidoreductase, mitochondrial isoform X3 [Harpegnathos saltator]